MITQSSIPYITQVLQEPHALTDADRDSIRSLVATYPYFVPARYMEAVQQHKKQPFEPAMMANMQLYMGNWVMFWEFIQEATGKIPEPDLARDEAFTNKKTEATAAPKTIEEYIAEEIEEVEEIEIHEDVPPVKLKADKVNTESDENLILPVYTEDYFLHEGIEVSNEIPEEVEDLKPHRDEDADKSLMVVMSFAEWLMHFKSHSQKAKEEQEGQKALRSMWQKEKLAAALEEENEEIPENVFEMAMNSITNEEDLVSESLAEIYIKQDKYDRAIEMYKKLSLRNPQKSAYFARKIEAVLKEKQS